MFGFNFRLSLRHMFRLVPQLHLRFQLGCGDDLNQILTGHVTGLLIKSCGDAGHLAVLEEAAKQIAVHISLKQLKVGLQQVRPVKWRVVRCYFLINLGDHQLAALSGQQIELFFLHVARQSGHQMAVDGNRGHPLAQLLGGDLGIGAKQNFGDGAPWFGQRLQDIGYRSLHHRLGKGCGQLRLGFNRLNKTAPRLRYPIRLHVGPVGFGGKDRFGQITIELHFNSFHYKGGNAQFFQRFRPIGGGFIGKPGGQIFGDLMYEMLHNVGQYKVLRLFKQ